MSGWKRTTKANPCPVCKRPNAEHTSQWCTVSPDGAAAICGFVESHRIRKDGRFFHRLADSPDFRRDYKPEPERPRPSIRWDVLLKQFEPRNGEVEAAAESLGVTARSLRRLRMGWDGEAATFPMCNLVGDVIGIRRRFPDGRKLSVPGGREGLFVPTGDMPNEVFVTEGPTDAAAALSLGLYAIGRPSCTGGVESLKAVTQDKVVVVIGDNDGPGRRGAEALAFALKARIVFPPVKDLRAWLKQSPGSEIISALRAEAEIIAKREIEERIANERK